MNTATIIGIVVIVLILAIAGVVITTQVYKTTKPVVKTPYYNRYNSPTPIVTRRLPRFFY